MNAVGFGTLEVLGTEKPSNQNHQLFSSYIIGNPYPNQWIQKEDIIVETVSSTKIIEMGNIAVLIASSKQAEDNTSILGQK